MNASEGELIKEFGQLVLSGNEKKHKILLLSIIGEVEGHDNVPDQHKTTQYNHVLPVLAAFEDNASYDGMLVILNTQGGDVDAGLAIAEMIASVSKPTVSLVLGGSHSIGVPLAVSTEYSFIVPSGTMLIHPVRMGGTVIGAPQSFDYFKKIQDRITGFVSSHSHVSQDELEKMMLESGELTKDLGTLLTGQEAVDKGLINEVGGISDALKYLYKLIETKTQS